MEAKLAPGFLVGFIVCMYTDEDYAAWRKLEWLAKSVIALKERVSELLPLPEMAKKRCMAGILRAESARSRRRPPYHRALTMLLVVCFGHPSWSQTIDHYEGILIDTSGSISRGGRAKEFFREYLIGTRKLLLTVPPNTRVWVSSISSDSFGGIHVIVKGWTPDARGVFTDDLNRARLQLASAFEAKSAGMSPMASGTDIFGGLWHMKAVFESGAMAHPGASTAKTIWIFPDMINETKEFPVPELMVLGSQEMLGRAKDDRLIFDFKGFKVDVCRASTVGLTPQAWMTVKDFWMKYFLAAGAELISYSAECDVTR